MKNPIKFLLLFCVLSFFSCKGSEIKVEPELIVSVEELNFGREAETKKLAVKSNVAWSLTISSDWCTSSLTSGDAGTKSMEIRVTENAGSQERSAIITVTAGDVSKTVDIIQKKGAAISIATKEYRVEAEANELKIEFQAMGTLELEIKDNWIVEKSSATNEKTFTISKNPALFEREGSIVFKVDNVSEKVIITQSGVSLNIAANKTGMETDVFTLASNMKIGWNLGNSLEATDGDRASEVLWGNAKTSKELITAVKNAGFSTVRIPCAWNAYIEDANTYRIKNAWLERVKEVVDYCIDNGMYAIINIHWDGGWLEENPTYSKQAEVNKKQKALWEQIAVYFRDYDEHLLFAGTNEVHANYGTPTTENITVQLSYNQTFVDAVRSTGGRNTWRTLIVQAYNTNIDYAVQHLKMATDPTAGRMMAEVHYYDPYGFCLEESGNTFLWGKDFAGMPGIDNWGQEDWADAQFNKMKVNFVDKGYPVVLGEYAASLRSSLSGTNLTNHLKARNYYLNYITKKALENGLVPCYWDNGGTGNNASGLFNRATGTQVHSDAIEAITR